MFEKLKEALNSLINFFKTFGTAVTGHDYKAEDKLLNDKGYEPPRTLRLLKDANGNSRYIIDPETGEEKLNGDFINVKMSKAEALIAVMKAVSDTTKEVQEDLDHDIRILKAALGTTKLGNEIGDDLTYLVNCIDYITESSETLKNNIIETVDSIRKYNEASFGDTFWSSAGMALVKLGAGATKFTEKLVDTYYTNKAKKLYDIDEKNRVEAEKNGGTYEKATTKIGTIFSGELEVTADELKAMVGADITNDYLFSGLYSGLEEHGSVSRNCFISQASEVAGEFIAFDASIGAVSTAIGGATKLFGKAAQLAEGTKVYDTAVELGTKVLTATSADGKLLGTAGKILRVGKSGLTTKAIAPTFVAYETAKGGAAERLVQENSDISVGKLYKSATNQAIVEAGITYGLTGGIDMFKALKNESLLSEKALKNAEQKAKDATENAYKKRLIAKREENLYGSNDKLVQKYKANAEKASIKELKANKKLGEVLDARASLSETKASGLRKVADSAEKGATKAEELYPGSEKAKIRSEYADGKIGTATEAEIEAKTNRLGAANKKVEIDRSVFEKLDAKEKEINNKFHEARKAGATEKEQRKLLKEAGKAKSAKNNALSALEDSEKVAAKTELERDIAKNKDAIRTAEKKLTESKESLESAKNNLNSATEEIKTAKSELEALSDSEAKSKAQDYIKAQEDYELADVADKATAERKLKEAQEEFNKVNNPEIKNAVEKYDDAVKRKAELNSNIEKAEQEVASQEENLKQLTDKAKDLSPEGRIEKADQLKLQAEKAKKTLDEQQQLKREIEETDSKLKIKQKDLEKAEKEYNDAAAKRTDANPAREIYEKRLQGENINDDAILTKQKDYFDKYGIDGYTKDPRSNDYIIISERSKATNMRIDAFQKRNSLQDEIRNIENKQQNLRSKTLLSETDLNKLRNEVEEATKARKIVEATITPKEEAAIRAAKAETAYNESVEKLNEFEKNYTKEELEKFESKKEELEKFESGTKEFEEKLKDFTKEEKNYYELNKKTETRLQEKELADVYKKEAEMVAESMPKSIKEKVKEKIKPYVPTKLGDINYDSAYDHILESKNGKISDHLELPSEEEAKKLDEILWRKKPEQIYSDSTYTNPTISDGNETIPQQPSTMPGNSGSNPTPMPGDNGNTSSDTPEKEPRSIRPFTYEDSDDSTTAPWQGTNPEQSDSTTNPWQDTNPEQYDTTVEEEVPTDTTVEEEPVDETPTYTTTEEEVPTDTTIEEEPVDETPTYTTTEEEVPTDTTETVSPISTQPTQTTATQTGYTPSDGYNGGGYNGGSYNGGGYYSDNGYYNETSSGYYEEPQIIEEIPTTPVDDFRTDDVEVSQLIDSSTTTLDDIVTPNDGHYTTIPTPTAGSATQRTTGGSKIIPIAAGLSAAAAAGIGAKAYLDHKKNNDNSDDEEDYDEYEDYETDFSSNGDIKAEEWNDGNSESLEIQYDNPSNKQEEYLDDDEYTETEKYGARSNQELTDLQ